MFAYPNCQGNRNYRGFCNLNREKKRLRAQTVIWVSVGISSRGMHIKTASGIKYTKRKQGRYLSHAAQVLTLGKQFIKANDKRLVLSIFVTLTTFRVNWALEMKKVGAKVGK